MPVHLNRMVSCHFHANSAARRREHLRLNLLPVTETILEEQVKQRNRSLNALFMLIVEIQKQAKLVESQRDPTSVSENQKTDSADGSRMESKRQSQLKL